MTSAQIIGNKVLGPVDGKALRALLLRFARVNKELSVWRSYGLGRMSILQLQDTIVALSTGWGRSWRGIIRISGPAAVDICQKIFVPTDRRATLGQGSGGVVYGRVMLDAGRVGAPAIAWVFGQPTSYTGQDLVELHIIGSPALIEMVQSDLQELGARQATAGEFTARAFLNGKLDLAQAEAVGNLVAAVNDVQLQAANRLIAGALSKRLRDILDKLTDLVVLLEANIDFSEEQIELIGPDQIALRLEGLIDSLAGLLDSSVNSEALNYLPQVLLLGPANVGKSSLMNKLSGTDRSICSPLPGTTRDILSAIWQWSDRQCLLLDGAGVGQSCDPLADHAAKILWDQIPLVDLIIFVIDIGTGFDSASVDAVSRMPGEKLVLAANKADLLTSEQAKREVAGLWSRFGRQVLAVSALKGQGLDKLAAVVFDKLGGGVASLSDQALALSLRQRGAVAEAIEALKQARQLSGSGAGMEMIAAEIRYGLDELGVVLGKVGDEGILDEIFSRFCIGK